MAILLDKRARDAVAHRRARGRDTAIALRVVTAPYGRRTLVADWASPGKPVTPPVRWRTADGLDLYLDARIARYARWHDLPVSGWRLGPLAYLTVVGEPLALRDMARWEQLHPAAGHVSLA